MCGAGLRCLLCPGDFACASFLSHPASSTFKWHEGVWMLCPNISACVNNRNQLEVIEHCDELLLEGGSRYTVQGAHRTLTDGRPCVKHKVLVVRKTTTAAVQRPHRGAGHVLA